MSRCIISKHLNAWIILLILLSIGFRAFADNNDAQKVADADYIQGIQAYKEGDYEEALKYFRKSYLVKPHTQTAYMISASFLKLKRFEEAYTFAKMALEGEPYLQEPYRSGAIKVMTQAKTASTEYKAVGIRGSSDDDRGKSHNGTDF